MKTDQGWVECNDSQELRRNLPAPKKGYIIIYDLKSNESAHEGKKINLENHDGSVTDENANEEENMEKDLLDYFISAHEGEKHKCPNCDEIFMESSGLQLHIESVHESDNLVVEKNNPKKKQNPKKKKILR